MEPTYRPRLLDGLELRRLGAEVIAYDPRSDATYLFNLSAAAVLELCDGTRSAAEIARAVQVAYGVDGDELVGEVEAILGELRQRGLFDPEGADAPA